MSETIGRTILVVDDDATYRGRLVRALSDRGLTVFAAGSYDEAVRSAETDSPEMALVDLRLPGRSGLDVVKRLKELDATTTVVVLTGYGSIATAVESVRLGATTYLTKPVDADQILAALDGTTTAADPAVTTPSLARVEWEHIHRVMQDCEGNISEAARRLGLHRRSLQRKLAKYPVRESS
jgi:two-component system response regulator RegA